jgi:hypothetical protein
MENYKDFANKKTRLNKRDYSADFRLADNDDFFGFDSKEGDFTLTQVIVGALIAVPVLWFVLVVLLSMTPNI